MTSLAIKKSFNQFYNEIKVLEKHTILENMIQTKNENNFQYNDFKICKKEILSTCDSIADSLEEYHIIPEEFYDFLEIEDIIEEVLSKDYIEDYELKEIEFLNKLLKDFNEIIKYRYRINKNNNLKYDEIPEKDLRKYKKEYESFAERLNKYEWEFSAEIMNYEGEEKLDPVNQFMLNHLSKKLFGI